MKLLIAIFLMAVVAAYAGGPKPAGKWHISNENDPVDHSQKTYLTLEAEGASGGPMLYVRKTGDTIDIYIVFFTTQIGSEGTDVTLRWDSRKPVTQAWGIGMSEKSLFCHSLGDFFDNLMKSHKLTVSLAPAGKKPLTLVFDINGFTEAVKSLGIVELPVSGSNTPTPAPAGPETISFPTPQPENSWTGFGGTGTATAPK